MGCCGNARANVTLSPVAPPVVGMAASGHKGEQGRRWFPRLAAPNQPVLVRYVGSSGIVVRGPSTGTAYTFAASGNAQLVDSKDAAVLLRTSYFRQA